VGRILIVDDEKAVREMIASALTRSGLEAVTAASVSEGLEVVHQRIPDLIISDVCMEGGDGFSFLETVRRNPRTEAIPFIILTGHPDPEGMLRGIENAVDGYIPKPLSLGSLITAVQKRLSRERAIRRDASEIKTQLYRVLQASPDLIGMLDPESLCLFFLNAAGRKLLGTQDDFCCPLTEFFLPSAAENLRAHAIPAALRAGQWVGETVLIALSGTRVPVEIVLQAHNRHDGKVDYLSIIAHDLAERKENERALRASEFRFRALVDALPDAVLMYERTGQITFCNANAAKLLCYPPQELLNLTAFDVFRGPPPTNSGGETSFYKHGQTGGDDEVYRKTGEAVPVSAFVEHLEVEGERLELCILHNLTERKRIERERQDFEIQLRQAQKLESIGQLAAGIAHEINTPTQYIGDNTRFLKESFQSLLGVLQHYQKLASAVKTPAALDAQLQALEDAIQAADLEYLLAEIPNAIEQSLEGIERVSKIVRAMKDFSHPNSTEKSLIDANHAIETTLMVARNEWKYVADLETSFDKSLPPLPCLPGEFNQVILNLVVNAAHAIGDVVKGTENKGIIRISTACVGDSFEIRISDTGTGIPPAAQKRIFEPFFTTKEVGKGTGQGLAIARSVIVEKHDGSISFETEEGKGTTFIIRLPKNASN
jgi:two-component system, NtrC family, sensor kinase